MRTPAWLSDHRVGFIAGVLLVAGVVLAGAAVSTLTATDNSIDANAGSEWGCQNGPTIELGQDVTIYTNDPFQCSSPQQVVLKTSKGDITAESSADVRATVTEINGSYTNLTNINTSAGKLTVIPGDKPAFVVGGAIDEINMTAISPNDAGDGIVDFRYSGPDGTTSTVILTNLKPGKTYAAVAAGDGSTLDVAEANSNGRLTFELPNSDHRVLLQKESNEQPSLSNLSPNGETIQTRSATLAVTVDDPDFGDGDSVTVQIYLDGTKVKETTISSKTRVTVDVSGLAPGDHSWRVNATDEIGQTATKDATFAVPGYLKVKNVTDPGSLLSNTSVTGEFYLENGTVLNRTVSDGTISLTGLPTDELIAVELRANGYKTRTYVVSDIAANATAWLHPTNASTLTVRFTISDQTGRYPANSQTALFVKRPLTINGTTKYYTVAANTFGSDGIIFEFTEGVRYRLVIRNADGDMRVLGSFVPDAEESVNLRISTVDFNVSGDKSWTSSARFDNSSNGQRIVFKYQDETDSTEEIKVIVYEHGNKDNVLLDQTYDGPFGKFRGVLPLSDAEAKKTWVVIIKADRDGDAAWDVSQDHLVGKSQLPVQVGLRPLLKYAIGVMFLLVIGAGLGANIHPSVGALGTSLLAGVLVYIAWLPPVVGFGSVALAIAASGAHYARVGGVT